jgi:predicted secreted hydrolase
MDHEWGTSALSDDPEGWDWFVIQFNDSSEILCYQMRKKNRTADLFSKGIIIDKNGSSRLIKKNDVYLEVSGYWESLSRVK